MKTHVRKWGNSLALRLPKRFAEEAGIGNETLVELTVRDGTIVVTPEAEPDYTLEELLARVTPENVHREVYTGGAVGDETW